MSLKLLGFDYGASNGRGMLGEYDGNRLALSEVHRFDNTPVWMGRHLRWDFPRLFHELKIGMRKAAAACGGAIGTIGVNTWGVEFGLMDEYGALISNPFHYRDDLTEDAMEGIRTLISDEELYRRTGIQFMRFNTIYQLYALKKLYPSIYERVEKLLFMPDLFGFFLTGEMTAEYSIASTTAMLDVKARNWDVDLLGIAGINPDILPEIAMPGTLLGDLVPQVSDETGVSGAKVISVCGHDTAGAVLASPLRKDSLCAYLSCGTWSLLGVESDEPLTNEAAFNAQYTNEGGYGGNIRFLKNIMGQWMANEIKGEYERTIGPISYDEIRSLEQKAKPLVSLIDVNAPEFAQPGRMTEKVGAFCDRTGQKKPDGLGALIRCVNESIALSYRVNIDALEKILGHGIPEIRAVGGGINNRSLMSKASDALARPVRTGPAEASSTGNILAQLLAIGEIKDRWEARGIVENSIEEEVCEPDPAMASRWKEAIDKYNATVRGM
jgi:rhamnulokinase